MAGLALLAETAFMFVIFAMATDTGFRGFFVVGVFVAVLAFHVIVLA